MEVQNDQPGYIIEISRDLTSEGSSHGTSKMCSGAQCGFSDAGTLRMPKNCKIAGGIKANSLAILTDAAHLLSEVAAFGISLFSLWASSWEANPRQSYGFFRIEILGTLVSIQMIWLLAGMLVYEAIARIINDTGEVQGLLMFLVSGFGLVVNLVMAVLLGHDHGHGGHGHDGHGHDHGTDGHEHAHSHDVHGHSHNHDHEHNHAHESDHLEPLLKVSEDGHTKIIVVKEKKRRNINIQGAYLHVLGDSIQSLGMIDLICTLIFSVIVLGTTIRMLRNILEVLMESTPREIDATMLEKDLCEMDEVIAIHELHIWAITVGKVLLACHVKVNPDADADLVLEKVIDHIKRVYNISHVTIQVER
ncbi:hypothetical protein MKX01_035737 [Papaver californicum]|nr:hypothetical protein MKX01_035737 [Papaver californicum]